MKLFPASDWKEDRNERELREHSLLQQAMAYARNLHAETLMLLQRAEEFTAAYNHHAAERSGERINHLSSAVGEATLQFDRRQRAQKAEVVAVTHMVDALTERLEALEKKVARPRGPSKPFKTSAASTASFFGNALTNASVEAALTAVGPIFVIKGDLVGDSLIATGVWDEHIYPMIESAANRGGACVDVGAQFGIHSCVLASFFPEVFAFEPNIVSFRVLALNSFFRPRIRPFNLALYDSEGVQSLSKMSEQDIPFEVNPQMLQMERSGNVGSVSFSPDGTSYNSVRSMRLDSLRLNNISFIKIDAQGADGRVLRGARETIERCRPTIVFEWEDRLAINHGIELDEIVKMLRGMRYDVRKIKEHNAKQVDYVALPI